MGLHSLRQRIMDAPDSLAAKRRARRWQWLLETFPDFEQMSVVDLGGTLLSWQRAPVRPKHLHVINVSKPPKDVPDWAEVERADACALPDHIAKRRYDLVYSNSVIEHVGGHERRLRFAESVHRLADRHWVQTPYRYFPIEPHWLFPGLQFLPVAARTAIVYRWPLVSVPGRPRSAVLSSILWTELIDRTQMRLYFPDSQLLAERVLGLTKSLIAVRTG
ncbi:MAG TPA: class I SAM-dependent methyltransferase [Micromonosporaceae bacterium]|nr:class I SAM-dependent methyltransferase [Micromonosporaceae bacterium]